MTDAPFQTAPVTSHQPGQPPVTRAVIVLTASSVGLFLLAAALGFTLVGRAGGGPVQSWDDSAWRWGIHHRGPFVGLARVVATWGDAPFLGAICVALTAALVVRLRSVVALVPLTAYLGAEFQVFALRLIIHRHRPPTAVFPARGAVRGIHETNYSFPSGHAVAVTAVLFAGLGMLALSQRRTWPWLLALMLSLCVAATRLILGVHWLSDLSIGMLVGIAWGSTVALVARRIRSPDVEV